MAGGFYCISQQPEHRDQTSLLAFDYCKPRKLTVQGRMPYNVTSIVEDGKTQNRNELLWFDSMDHGKYIRCCFSRILWFALVAAAGLHDILAATRRSSSFDPSWVACQ
jgi:hypothetical protein